MRGRINIFGLLFILVVMMPIYLGCSEENAGQKVISDSIDDGNDNKGGKEEDKEEDKLSGGENPEVENPGGENPEVENPGGENPEVENPGGENPEVENPGGENPGGENPGGETEVIDPISLEEMHGIVDKGAYFYFDYPSAMKASSAEDSFFHFPYPNGMRTDAHGRPNIKGYRLPNIAIPAITRVIESVGLDRPGFSPQGAIYFQSSVNLKQEGFPSPERSLGADSCVQLINVEEGSSDYGKRVALEVSYHASADKIWSDYMLVLKPVPGLGMRSGEQYAAIVLNCFENIYGVRVQGSQRLKVVLEGKAPEMYQKVFAPGVKGVKDAGVNLEKIVAMTVFRTSNVVKEMELLASDVVGKGKLVHQKGKRVAKGSYETHKDSYVFTGEFETWNYMEGSKPYMKAGEARINFSEDGTKLLSKGQAENVKYSISIPKGVAMPAKGFPLIIYGHGTGGNSKTHCDGYASDEGEVLAAQKVPVAMLGFDAALQGERWGKSTVIPLEALFLVNAEAVRESVRQTVIDMMVLYELLEKGEIILPPLPGNASGGANVKFDGSYGLFMGHSQGSQEAGVLLGFEKRIKNAFLSAGGGGLTISFTERPISLDFDNGFIKFKEKDIIISDFIAKYILQIEDTKSFGRNHFIVNQIVQPFLDNIDPLNFAHRFIKEPPAGMEPKNIVMTVGMGDTSTPPNAQYALHAAIGLPIIGKVYHMAKVFELAGLSPQKSPASENVVGAGGKKVTAGAIQFKRGPKDNFDGHFVIYYMKEAQQTYPDFFNSVVAGKPSIKVKGQK